MSTSTPTNADFFFGWDLLYKSIESSVMRKSDVLVALTHFVLMKYSNFRCLGVGEDKVLGSDEVGSELLPDNWNSDEDRYALRYVSNMQLYLLLGYTSENCFILNLLDVKTKKVSNIALEPDELVMKTKGSITDLIPTAAQLTDRLRKELIDPVYSGGSREVTTQTTVSPDPPANSDPLRITGPMQPRGPFIPSGGFGPDIGGGIGVPRPFGLPEYGASDLDPLGRLGTGNLLPFPPNPAFQGQPRFDPFTVPDRNVRPNPDHDHLPPPGFNSNYFS